MIPPGRCGTGVPPSQLHPGDAAEITRFRAYLADVGARVRAGATRDDARRTAYPEHYPDDREGTPCASPTSTAPATPPPG